MNSDRAACSICQLKEFKYTCPACGMRTCSSECVKRHKRQTECSGQVDASQFVSKAGLLENETFVNRDYNFLLNVGRNVELGKEDVKSRAKNAWKRQHLGGPTRNIKRVRVEDQNPRLEQVYKVYEQKPNTCIKRKNTMVIQVPAGMSRAMSNKSGYDKKAGTFIWTVEWVVVDEKGRETTRFVSYRLKELQTVEEAFPANVLKTSVKNEGMEAKIDSKQLQFYLKNVLCRFGSKKSMIRVKKLDPLCDVLTNKIVLEYPTIYVTLDREAESETIVSEEKAYCLSESDVGSGSDTESSSSSDESSSESDNESDSDSGSDSDSDSDTQGDTIISPNNKHDDDEASGATSKITITSTIPRNIENSTDKESTKTFNLVHYSDDSDDEGPEETPLK